MNELLQKLLEADVLSEETKAELETAFQTKLDEAITAAKDSAAADVTAQLTEEWVKERDQLVEAVDSKVTEFLADEMSEIKEDIERFRDLEAEHAEKLVEAKSEMADELKTDLGELVEKIDAFLEIRLNSEMDELREDLEVVKKNDMGRRIFEAFQTEFLSSFADEDSARASMSEMETRLADAQSALAESTRQKEELERSIKLEGILAPLAGKQREIMETILKNVGTDQLEEGFKTFIGRVIREDANSEKEGKVLAESDEDDSDDDDKDDDDKKAKPFEKKSKKKSDKKDDKKDDDKDDDDEELKEGRKITGDTEQMVTEALSDEDQAKAARLARLQRVAGIK